MKIFVTSFIKIVPRDHIVMTVLNSNKRSLFLLSFFLRNSSRVSFALFLNWPKKFRPNMAKNKNGPKSTKVFLAIFVRVKKRAVRKKISSSKETFLENGRLTWKQKNKDFHFLSLSDVNITKQYNNTTIQLCSMHSVKRRGRVV